MYLFSIQMSMGFKTPNKALFDIERWLKFTEHLGRNGMENVVQK